MASRGRRTGIDLDGGTQLWYAHLSSVDVAAGQRLAPGDVVGALGSTGSSTGPHLHLEVRPGGGEPVDPEPWLGARGLLQRQSSSPISQAPVSRG